MAFVAEAGFDNLGVFLYSDEEGTAAFDLDEKVPREVAGERRDRVMALQADIVGDRLSGWIGKTVRVLLDGFSSETDLLLEGRMETQAPEIDGRVLINDAGDFSPSSGEFYSVEITEALDYDLVGRIIGRV
jgi:ribosomal protein S12 methylthiotransferase